MTIYRSTGTLTGTIERDNVAAAQAYLTEYDMTEFLKGGLKERVERIQWHLNADGHSYYVEAIARRKLSKVLLKELADWVSGQNSDGLGENFEQQAFAESHEGECGECDGCEYGGQCTEDDGSGMISFDWETNDSTFSEV